MAVFLTSVSSVLVIVLIMALGYILRKQVGLPIHLVAISHL